LTCDFWAEKGEKNDGNDKGNKMSRFRPSGYAPAFGRAVAPSARRFFGTRKRVPFRQKLYAAMAMF
jgi:hypothetical protein